jgi:hypothetical protein
MKDVLEWMKKKPFVAAAIGLVALWLIARSKGTTILALVKSPEAGREGFSSCYQQKQFYLNATYPDECTGNADCYIEKRWGKMYINIQANLPYAHGGDFHTVWGAYHAFLVDSKTGKSVNLGSLVYGGDHFYRLRTELAGDYSDYDRVDVYRQTEDYKPKRVLSGSITHQGCSSL